MWRRFASALAGLLLIAGAMPGVAAEPSWNDPAAVRDIFFAWCMDVGWKTPPRAEEEMQQQSADCAGRSAALAEQFFREPHNRKLVDGAVAEACATSKGTRPVHSLPGRKRDGVCLEFPDRHRRSALDLVEVVRSALATGGDYFKASESALAENIRGLARLKLDVLLTEAGFDCRLSARTGNAECSISIGILGWANYLGRPRIGDLCRLDVFVRLGRDESTEPVVSAIGVCL